MAVYLAMPPHDALDLVADQVPLAGSVLDLGCGVGRLANALAGRGFYVTGVDNHAEMLAHLDPRVRGVLGDIATVDVGRLFDVVVLASHLVNEPDLGAAFVATCRRHVVADGVVLIERFHPALLDDLDQQEGVVDGVHVRPLDPRACRHRIRRQCPLHRRRDHVDPALPRGAARRRSVARTARKRRTAPRLLA